MKKVCWAALSELPMTTLKLFQMLHNFTLSSEPATSCRPLLHFFDGMQCGHWCKSGSSAAAVVAAAPDVQLLIQTPPAWPPSAAAPDLSRCCFLSAALWKSPAEETGANEVVISFGSSCSSLASVSSWLWSLPSKLRSLSNTPKHDHISSVCHVTNGGLNQEWF